MRNSILLFLLIFSFFGFIPQEVFANEISSPGWGWSHMMPWGWMNWGWGCMIGIGLIGLIVVLALIYLVFQNTRFSSDSGRRTSDDRPLEILQKRYAKGELSRDEYQKMKEDLKE